jgi:carboxypeptidase C (cathepsin A)
MAVVIGASAWALMSVSAAAPIDPHADRVVTTKNAVRLENGRTLQYTAHAGLFPLYVNDTGQRMASMFFIAYMADRSSAQPKRPITFLWNGGPGANSAETHFLGFGPKRPQTPSTYPEYGPRVEGPVLDHAETWLEHSDLVFVDPVGTGFSRATSEEHRAVLYTPHGDAEAVAEFIRIFLTRFGGWDAPLFVGGESYGTVRAMLVAEALERRHTRINGVLLMSGGYNAGQQVPQSLRDALAITEFTAIAHFHKRLPSDLQALPEKQAIERAAEWARNTYAPAIERRDNLSDAERATVLTELARYTGVNAMYADPKTLTLGSDVFADRLLADQGLELGRYDGRVTRKARPPGHNWLPIGPYADPSLEHTGDILDGTSRILNAYIRKVLGFESDLLYQGPFGGAFHPEPLVIDPQTGFASDWMASRFKFDGGDLEGPQGSEAPLRRAMILDPGLHVMNVKGLYDGSCELLDEAVARTEPELRRRVVTVCVPGGHMFYTDLAARQIAKRGFSDFVRRATAPQ